MSYDDRVELVEALLRNRAMMLDPKGRQMPGVSIWGIAPTDEEFQARARAIVDATGKDQRAAVVQIDSFGEEMGEKLDRRIAEIAEEALKESSGDPPQAPP